MSSLYIHIPFCRQKCLYCDFPSFSGQESLFVPYVEALLAELKEKSMLCQTIPIQTIFFGGGTPTLLPASLLEQLLAAIFEYYTVAPDAEITIEANPGTVTLPLLKTLRQSGYNRISMGLQAWQDTLLHCLGRIHTRSVFLENYFAARQANFTNINIDLMFALPHQTYAQWEETLRSVIALEPEHISAYSLIVEEGTPFATMYTENQSPLPEEALDRAMYTLAKQLLTTEGYAPYEISNFAKIGYESRHNQVYWHTQPYLGFGLGAHSLWQQTRYHNTYSLQQYISGQHATEDVEHLTSRQQQSEFMFLGLRMTKGISEVDFQNRFGIPLSSVYGKELATLQTQQLLQKQGAYYSLTNRGIDLSNTVFCEFL